jgi:hypothetical protein
MRYRRDDVRMRSHQAGTSVLAALVFVAIFVLFISGYKIVSQGGQGQAAAAASARTVSTESCRPGEVYTVNMESGAGSVQSLKCFVPDPGNPSVMIPGPDASRSECTQGVQGKCAVRYCPPSSYVTESGTCFVVASCEPGSESNGCLKGTIQNASQPLQAASIIAAQLLADKGETDAHVLGTNDRIALAEKLSDSGRVAVSEVIDETADAVDENNLDSAELRDIAREIKGAHSVTTSRDPIAQISCQPKVAESGMKIGIAFGCTNSLTSEGGGFSTGGRLWGATEDQLAENLPTGTMVYALTCANGARKATASCAVSVMKPFMLLTSTRAGDSASFAWITRGMDVCELSASGNSELSAQFGNPVTPSGALSIAMPSSNQEVTLTCTTVSGEVKQVSTTVR